MSDEAPSVRPFLLELLPHRLRLAVWSRLFRGSHVRRLSLYSAAPLSFAPSAKMRLLPGDVISDSIAFTGIYELALSRRVCELAARGGTLLEIGANLGYFALLWAAARADNLCLAVEASPRNVEMLRHNVKQNGLEAQIRVIPVAAGASRGIMPFDPGPADQTGWGGFTRESQLGAIPVEVVRVDDLADHHSPIALLKIDVEGADTLVLYGCEALLKARLVREIWYEQNKPRMRALDLPLDASELYLRTMGYTAVPEGDPTAEVVGWRAFPAAGAPTSAERAKLTRTTV